MTPIKFWVFPRAEVEALFRRSPIPADALQKWEDARPRILNDDEQDVVSVNCRTETQRWTAYDLFEQVGDVDSADFVLCQNWLELFEAFGVRQNIRMLLDHLVSGLRGKLLVTSWNHDRDAASVPELQSLPSNVLVLQFNTSKVNPSNDILVPFWSIDSRVDPLPKKHFCRFRGHVGRVEVRQRLRSACDGKADYLVTDQRLTEKEYLTELAETVFALCPRGGGLSSFRVSEAVHCGAIPILFADDAKLPWESRWFEGDYKFAVRIPECDSGNFDKIDATLRACDVPAMQEGLRIIRPKFSVWGVQKELYRRLEERLWG